MKPRGTPPPRGYESAEHGPSLDEMLLLFRSRGMRVTTARRALLVALVQAAGHSTAEDLATEVTTSHPDVHISTVYRNLDGLEQLGLVVHSHLGHSPASYHFAMRAHPHLVCENCRRVIEAPGEILTELIDVALVRWGFEVNPFHFAIPGRCQDCRQRGVAPAKGHLSDKVEPERNVEPSRDAGQQGSRPIRRSAGGAPRPRKAPSGSKPRPRRAGAGL